LKRTTIVAMARMLLFDPKHKNGGLGESAITFH
jgi:hypothetical protein